MMSCLQPGHIALPCARHRVEAAKAEHGGNHPRLLRVNYEGVHATRTKPLPYLHDDGGRNANGEGYARHPHHEGMRASYEQVRVVGLGYGYPCLRSVSAYQRL